MRRSVLEAIRAGVWDYEPLEANGDQYSSTIAMPGSQEKIDMLATRAAEGLPLWHEEDRLEWGDENNPTLA